MKPRDVTQSQPFTTKEMNKNMTQGESMERQNLSRGLMEMNPRFSGAQVGIFPMGKVDTVVMGGGIRREQSIYEESDLGEQNLAEDRKRIPSTLILNSEAKGNGKRSDLKRSCWIGSGLIVKIGVKGRRRVAWDRTKRGVKSFKWVSRAYKDLGMGSLGVDSNKLTT